MSVAIPDRRTWRPALAWGGFALVAFLILVYLLHDSLFHGRALQASSPPETAEAAASAPAGGEPATTVTLPEGKWKVAGITTAPAERTRVAAEVGVTGRIE